MNLRQRTPHRRVILFRVWLGISITVAIILFLNVPHREDEGGPVAIVAVIFGCLISAAIVTSFLVLEWLCVHLIIPPASWAFERISQLAMIPARRRESMRERQERAARSHEQKRREDARARCQLLYRLHAPEIGNRFPQGAFDEFCKLYLGDNRSPDYVEERAKQLEAVIIQHREYVEPSERFTSLGDLTAWFEEQKGQIEACPDDRMRRSLLVQLKERYSELSAELLEQI